MTEEPTRIPMFRFCPLCGASLHREGRHAGRLDPELNVTDILREIRENDMAGRLLCTCTHHILQHSLGRETDGGAPLLSCYRNCGCDLFTAVKQ